MFSLEIINAINEKGTAQGGVAQSKARYWINKGIVTGLQEAIELITAEIEQVDRTPARRLRKIEVLTDLGQTIDILKNWQRLADRNEPGLGLANRTIQGG